MHVYLAEPGLVAAHRQPQPLGPLRARRALPQVLDRRALVRQEE